MITKRIKAFLLIEVLVTVVLVTTCIIFINHAFTSSFKAAALSNDYLNAVLVLEDKLFDFELNPPAEEGESSGEIEFEGRSFAWEESVSPLEQEDVGETDEEEDIKLKRLKYILRWQKQNVGRSIEILTYTTTEEEKAEG